MKTSAGDSVVALGFDHGSLSVGGSGAGVTVTGASGWLVITAQGVAGQLSGTPTFTIAEFASITSTVTVDINTTGSAINETIPTGSGTTTLTLDAGPFVRVSLLNTQVTIDGVTVSGNFFFERATESEAAPWTR